MWCKDSQNTNANKKKRIQATACCQGLVFNLLSLWCRLRKIYESVSKSRGFVCVFDLFFFFNYSTDIVVFYKHSTDAMETVLFSYNTQTKIHLLTERRFNPLFFYFIFFYSSESRTLSSSDSACGGKSQKYHGEFSPGFSYRTDMKIFGKKKNFLHL